MIAFYDNSLPIAYANMRQHARRANHKTLLAHHMDMMSQVRAEINARAPPPTAFVASVAPANASPNPNLKRPAGPDADKTCLRCGRPGHTRRVCRQTKAPCTHCGGDHLPAFCPKGPGGRRRGCSSRSRQTQAKRKTGSPPVSQSVSQFHGPAPRSPLHRLAVRLRHSRSNTSTEYSLPGATQLSQV